MSEYIKTNDIVYFTANFYHPTSGYSKASDSTPQWLVYENSGVAPILNGNMTARTNIPGSYYGSFVASLANGFDAANFYDVQVSGSIENISGITSVKQFVVDDIYDVNVVQVSGETITYATAMVDANVVQVSGVMVGLQSSVDANVVTVSGIPVSFDPVVDTNIVSVSNTPVDINSFNFNNDIYFAAIKYVADATNNRDEFAVHWFKNDQPVSSGALTNPRISVYNTSTGAAVFAGQAMAYASPNLGVARYNTVTTLLASGEPYLVETSGIIDSSMRTWRNIVGVDLL